MLSVAIKRAMQNVVMQNVVMQNVVMHNVIILNAIILRHFADIQSVAIIPIVRVVMVGIIMQMVSCGVTI